jgi:hypothetical protein
VNSTECTAPSTSHAIQADISPSVREACIIAWERRSPRSMDNSPYSLLPGACRYLVQHGAELSYRCHGLRLSGGAALVAGDRLLGERDDVGSRAVVGPEVYLTVAGEPLAEPRTFSIRAPRKP